MHRLVTLLLLVLLCERASAGSVCHAYSTKAYCEPVSPSRFENTLPQCGPAKGNSAIVKSRFVVLGDFGLAEANCEGHVAKLIHKFEAQFGTLDFIMTTGDNNYWNGKCGGFPTSVGAYYSSFFPAGSKCIDPPADPAMLSNETEESTPIRFFPTIGNHDWDSFASFPSQLPYLQYFSYLRKFRPNFGNGTFYTYSPVAHVQLFCLNSNFLPEASGEAAEAYYTQKKWLAKELAASRAAFKLVYFHHPPFCTAQHDPPATWMDWPFEEWGATVVLSGHQHVYERLVRPNGLTYIVNGLGGMPWLYDINSCDPHPSSRRRYNSKHGAMLGLVTQSPTDNNPQLHFCFYSVDEVLRDNFVLEPKEAGLASNAADSSSSSNPKLDLTPNALEAVLV